MTTVAERLSHAQSNAALLFREIEARQIIRAGESEAQISDAIHEIGRAKFGVDKHWDKDLQSRARAQGARERESAREGDGTLVMSECRPQFRARWNGGPI